MSSKTATVVCIILSLYLILLYKKKHLASVNHSSVVFIYVAIAYAIFWRETDVENKVSFFFFFASVACFIIVLCSNKKTPLVETAYVVLATYTVTEIWDLGTAWCCDGQKSMTTFYTVSCLSS